MEGGDGKGGEKKRRKGKDLWILGAAVSQILLPETALGAGHTQKRMGRPALLASGLLACSKNGTSSGGREYKGATRTRGSLQRRQENREQSEPCHPGCSVTSATARRGHHFSMPGLDITP